MPKKLPSIRMFFSHRYKSPEVNLYFFGVFRELAEIHFGKRTRGDDPLLLSADSPRPRFPPAESFSFPGHGWRDGAETLKR